MIGMRETTWDVVWTRGMMWDMVGMRETRWDMVRAKGVV